MDISDKKLRRSPIDRNRKKKDLPNAELYAERYDGIRDRQ